MPSLLLAWFTWVALAFFYAYQIVARTIPNIIMNDIINKYHVNAIEISHYAGMYYVGYVMMHLPLGILLDSFNAKKVIVTCVFFTVLGFLPLVCSDNFSFVVYGRLFTGIGGSGSAVGAFTLLRLGFGEKKFPKMLSWMITIGLLFSVFSTVLLVKLILYLGFTKVLYFIIFIGVLLAIFSYLVIPNTNVQSKFKFIEIFNNFKSLISKKVIILIGVFGGVMIGPMEGFIDAWCNPYLNIVHHFTNEQATEVTQLAIIGMALGLIVIGHIFERTKAYYFLIIISGLFMFGCFVLMLTEVTKSYLVLKILFFFVGFFSSYQLIVIAKSSSILFFDNVTFVSAISNMIMMSFGYFFHRVIGKVLDCNWDGTLNFFGVPVYSANNINYALMVFPTTLAIGILGYIFLAFLEKRNKKNY